MERRNLTSTADSGDTVQELELGALERALEESVGANVQGAQEGLVRLGLILAVGDAVAAGSNAVAGALASAGNVLVALAQDIASLDIGIAAVGEGEGSGEESREEDSGELHVDCLEGLVVSKN